MTYRDELGTTHPYLTHDEASCLQIRRGSLTETERLEINSHVVHTYNFLVRIPWSRTLKDVPEIAGAHHEKLDGTGYPDRLKGDEIPLAAQVIGIADVYDALTTTRSYRGAMTHEAAVAEIARVVEPVRQ